MNIWKQIKNTIWFIITPQNKIFQYKSKDTYTKSDFQKLQNTDDRNKKTKVNEDKYNVHGLKDAT